MKKLFLLFLIFALATPYQALAVNTYSTDLERDSSQYFYYVNDAKFYGAGDFTIEFWINVESFGVGNNPINKYGPLGRGWSVQLQSGNICVTLSDDGSATAPHFFNGCYAHGLTADDTWHHFAWVVDASTKSEVFKDGVSIGSSSTSIPSGRNSDGNELRIGQTEGVNYFDGLIDEVRIWNTARTETEINDNYCDEITGSETGLAFYWKFNNNASDSGPNGYTLNAVNSPTYSSTNLPECAGGYVPLDQNIIYGTWDNAIIATST